MNCVTVKGEDLKTGHEIETRVFVLVGVHLKPVMSVILLQKRRNWDLVWVCIALLLLHP